MVVVYHAGFFLSVYDFYPDAGLFLYGFDDGRSVFRVTHGGGGAGAVVRYIVDFHQVLVGFHKPDHVLFFLFRYFSG